MKNGPKEVEYLGVENVAKAAMAAGVERFVLISAVSVTRPWMCGRSRHCTNKRASLREIARETVSMCCSAQCSTLRCVHSIGGMRQRSTCSACRPLHIEEPMPLPSDHPLHFAKR